MPSPIAKKPKTTPPGMCSLRLLSAVAVSLTSAGQGKHVRARIRPRPCVAVPTVSGPWSRLGRAQMQHHAVCS
jgi:hypothetical protein